MHQDVLRRGVVEEGERLHGREERSVGRHPFLDPVDVVSCHRPDRLDAFPGGPKLGEQDILPRPVQGRVVVRRGVAKAGAGRHFPDGTLNLDDAPGQQAPLNG